MFFDQYGNLMVNINANSGGGSIVQVADPTAPANKLAVDGVGKIGINALPALPAGTAVIGHIIVDSAGNVTITSLPALPAGSNNIGGVELIDSAGTNKLAIDGAGKIGINALPALPAGTNVIGHVIVDSGTAVAIVQPTSATATVTSVNAAASDTSLVVSNTNRKGIFFYNDSTAILYLLFGTSTASTTNYTVQVPAQGFFEMPTAPVFTGGFHGIWSAAAGSVKITELS